jgi:Cdc6-like AAA superfamily ATPase
VSTSDQALPLKPLNPFPASAVARLSPLETEGVSIATPALEQALSYADDYISRIRREGTDTADLAEGGNVVAIVGEYGTGKTHIALHLLRRIAPADEGLIHAMYLDAPADTFLALYRDRFIPKLSKMDVRNRVAEYYADLVAEQLSDSELTANTAEALRARELSPENVVRHLGLMEADFLQILNTRLRVVTEMDDFGTALTLFLRPEFEAAVWDWLSCNPPDPVLVERGIHKTIDTDAEALEAMGVFALLYGHQGHRFVLIIDELEKVLSDTSPHRPDDGIILAFKKMLEIFGRTQAFLVLIGLPDFLEALPEDARQRIACLVRPTALTVSDAIRYIEESQRRISGASGIKPFSRDVVQYLVELAGGNARKVIRLCYHSYQIASSKNTDVTRAMVREAARDQFELTTTEDVQSEVARVFDASGWLFESEHNFGTSKRSPRANYWLPVGDQGAGCAVIIGRSILHPDEARRLAQLAKQISGSKTGKRLVVLVVNGYLADNVSKIINAAYDRVIVYSYRRFADDLEAAVKGIRQRLETAENENLLLLLRERLEEISRQNSGIRSSLEDVLYSTTRPALIEQAAERGVKKAFALVSGNPRISDTRFPGISTVFDDMMNYIASVRNSLTLSLDASLSTFRSPLEPSAREVIAKVESSPDVIPVAEVFGILHLIDEAVTAFRESVMVIVEMQKSGSRSGAKFWVISIGSIEGSARESLRTLCHTFDVLASQVGGSLESQPYLRRAFDRAKGESVTSARNGDFDTLMLRLSKFGMNVYDAVLRELEGRSFKAGY